MLKKLAKKAGLNKRVNPHLFRHSRATLLANKLTEAQMKEYFGWVQASEMASVYVHLSGRDVDSAILQLHGLTNQMEKKEEKFKTRNCQRCKQPNSPVSKFCQKCGAVLDVETALELENQRETADALLNELMKNQEFKDFMLKKVVDMGLEKRLLGGLHEPGGLA